MYVNSSNHSLYTYYICTWCKKSFCIKCQYSHHRQYKLSQLYPSIFMSDKQEQMPDLKTGHRKSVRDYRIILCCTGHRKTIRDYRIILCCAGHRKTIRDYRIILCCAGHRKTIRDYRIILCCAGHRKTIRDYRIILCCTGNRKMQKQH